MLHLISFPFLKCGPGCCSGVGNPPFNTGLPRKLIGTSLVTVMVNKVYMKRHMIILICMVSVLIFENSYTQPLTAYPGPEKGMQVFPNPVQSGHFVIENDSVGFDHVYRLLIFNSNGILLENKQLLMYKGISKQLVDVAGFSPGNYFVRIIDTKDPGFSFARQLLIN
jgi:hypothetical protein